MIPTNVAQVISELGSGVLEQKLAMVLSQVAEAVQEHRKGGEVSLKLKLAPAGSANQLNVTHTLVYKQPKKRGSIGEDDTSETIMFVNEGGNVTMFPEAQGDLFRDTDMSAQPTTDTTQPES